MKKFVLALLGTSVFLSLSAQCSMLEIPLQQRAGSATLVVEGTVTEQHSCWDAANTMIYTSSTIEVYKLFKGELSSNTIEVLTPGGIVGDRMIRVEPSLDLNAGETGIFLCEPVTRFNIPLSRISAKPRYEAYAAAQGFVKYHPETQTATDVFHTYTDIENEVYAVVLSPSFSSYIEIAPYSIHNSQRSNDMFSIASISGFSPSTVTAGTGTTITITGSGFGATQGSGTVGFKNADDGGATYINPLATQYISWSNTQIVVEVPADAGTGTIQVTQGSTTTSSSTLTVTYAHLNMNFDPGSGTVAYQTDHVDDNGSGGYTWRMNTAFDADASARASFMRAFDTWRCATGVNWTIGSTTSINAAVSDGTNTICFDNTSPLSAGVLGVCYSYWSGCASGPSIIWYVNELDIIFDEGSNINPLTWEYGPATPSGSEYDFETVAVHELGHGHQLGHVISPGAIMHYAISNGSSNRALGVNDLAGGNFVQAKSIVANICGPGAMTNYSCASPPVADFSGSPTTVCAGGSVAFTDLSTNTPTSWSWTFTGGTPSSSSSQNPTVTYNTPGTYAVSLTATNASGSDIQTVAGYITVNANPSATSSQTNLSCNGSGDGTASVVASGGDGNYSYNWTPGNPTGDGTANVTGLAAGTYTCTITDGNACSATSSFTITQPAAVSVSASATSNPICTGGNTTLNASGASTYLWMPGSLSGSSVVVSPASTTTYTVTGTNVSGCTGVATITITVNSCSGPTLKPVSCGATNLVLYDWLYNTPVTNATNYQYLLTNTVTNQTYTRVKGNSQPNMPLSWISGIQYGQSYYVQIRAYVGSSWGSYGPVCTISLAANAPGTQLNSSSCNATGLVRTSYIYCTAVTGASNYEFTLTSGAYTQSRTRTVNNIQLTQFTGLTANTTYTVTVREYSGGMWSLPVTSPTCTITMNSTIREMDQSVRDEPGEPQFAISLYPNPLAEGTVPALSINGADGQEATIRVFDISGRELTAYTLQVSGNTFTTSLADFPSLTAGVYLMQITVGDKTDFIRFVAE